MANLGPRQTAQCYDTISRNSLLKLRRFTAALICLQLMSGKLINALFFGGYPEREYSSKTGRAQQTINDRKHKVLNKLKKYEIVRSKGLASRNTNEGNNTLFH